MRCFRSSRASSGPTRSDGDCGNGSTTNTRESSERSPSASRKREAPPPPRDFSSSYRRSSASARPAYARSWGRRDSRSATARFAWRIHRQSGSGISTKSSTDATSARRPTGPFSWKAAISRVSACPGCLRSSRRHSDAGRTRASRSGSTIFPTAGPCPCAGAWPRTRGHHSDTCHEPLRQLDLRSGDRARVTITGTRSVDLSAHDASTTARRTDEEDTSEASSLREGSSLRWPFPGFR